MSALSVCVYQRSGSHLFNDIGRVRTRLQIAVSILALFFSISMLNFKFTMTHIFVYSPFRLVFGTLYPAYASYKAVRTKNVKEYVSTFLLFYFISHKALVKISG